MSITDRRTALNIHAGLVYCESPQVCSSEMSECDGKSYSDSHISGKSESMRLSGYSDAKKSDGTTDTMVNKLVATNVKTTGGPAKLPDSANIAGVDQIQTNLEFKEPKLSTRHHKIANEILETESSYVNHLEALYEVYWIPLHSIISKKQHAILFSNFPTLLAINREFLRQLTDNIQGHESEINVLGGIFSEFAPLLNMYSIYGKNFNAALETLKLLKKNNRRFAEFYKLQSKNPILNLQSFESILLMPIQRIPRYKLLLADLVKYTPADHYAYQQLERSLAQVSEVALGINETIRRHEKTLAMIEIQNSLSGFNEDLLVPGREFIKRGVVMKVSRKAHQQREMLLFTDCLMYAGLGTDVLFRVSDWPSFQQKIQSRLLETRYSRHASKLLSDADCQKVFCCPVRHGARKGVLG
jgi:RhoGEF domain